MINTIKFLPILFLFSFYSFQNFAKSDSLEIEKKKKEKSTIVDSLPEGYVPTLYPEIIKDRLACLQSTIKMTYHKDVLNWIGLYTIRQRDYTQRILERSSFYFPIFEEALKRHNMPEELKYLAIVESALRPKAKSWAAAVGLWQFIPSTGKEYGLKQDWYVDERMDIYKSTDAACRYLKFLYKYHGDWQLALAAYNCGPGRVNWAVKRAGGKSASFWSIYNYLPKETRSYVPAFIAACYSMTYSKEHFIFPKTPQEFIPSDTIQVNQFVNIDEFAKQIEVPKEQMAQLNPHLKKKAIPSYKKNYPLRFPASKKEFVAKNRDKILLASARATRRELPYTAGKTLPNTSNKANNNSSSTTGKKKITHTVKKGESLALVALKYGVSAYNIRIWNRLRSNIIHPYQNLTVWIKDDSKPSTPKQEVSKTPEKEIKNNNKTNTKKVETKIVEKTQKIVKTTTAKKVYTVKDGDTLWDIAVLHKVSVAQIKKLNNLTGNSFIVAGQKLVIE